MISPIEHVNINRWIELKIELKYETNEVMDNRLPPQSTTMEVKKKDLKTPPKHEAEIKEYGITRCATHHYAKGEHDIIVKAKGTGDPEEQAR